MISVDIPAAADGLSPAINVGNYRASGIQMPAAWTAGNLTFQVSADGVTYADLYDNTGTEYTATAAASRVILLPAVDFIGIQYLKIRSGTSGTPVQQAAVRSLKVLLAIAL